MNRIDLDGRAAIITGGAQGIGFAVAERFLRSGAEVCLWDREASRVAEAAGKLRDITPGAKVTDEVVDIGDAAAVEQAAARTAKKHGHVDILINNAAIVGPNAPLWEYPVDDWHAVVHVGVNGTFHCCRAVMPGMLARGYGRVVNVASVAGKEGNPNAAAYSSAKAAVIALTKSLGKEVARSNIAVNCVTPAVARTPGAMEQAPSHIEYMLSKIPRARFLELPEAAAMIAWLASEENSFTTGAVFDLSGGRATY